MKQFYVYGLIDPRTNSIFYIGKGKGKRILQHLNEKQRLQSNTEKLQIIKEIQTHGFEVGQILICENLSEDAALLLERLLIYRFGRKIFDEGVLTNIVLGGRWNREDSYFLKKNDMPSIETINTELPELIPILENYPPVATEFNGLRCPINHKDETLYVVDVTGNNLNEYNIDSFIQRFNLGYALDIINGLKNRVEPIYAFKSIWSKTKFEKIEDISKIPFQDFDIIDFEFVKRVNDALLKGNDILLNGLYPDGSKRTELKFVSITNTITFIYYFPNGNKKQEVEYQKNKRINKHCYFPSGNIEMSTIYNEDDRPKSIKKWYANGQLKSQDEDGVFYSYNEKGMMTGSGGAFHNGGIQMTWDYGENGNLEKEIKAYYPNGLRDIVCGYEKTFYDTGEIKTEIDYTNGLDKKIVKTFDKNGEVTIK